MGDRVAVVGVGQKKKSTRARRRQCLETRNDGLRSAATGYFVGARPEKVLCCLLEPNRLSSLNLVHAVSAGVGRQ